MKHNRITSVALGAAIIVLGSAGVGFAAGQVTSSDIADNTVRSVDLSDGRAVGRPDLKDGVTSFIESQDALAGAVYRVETYANGGGGSATVACADTEDESQKYVAISGGVQAGDVDTQDDGFAINSSFPGRMNWDTGQPKADRLDGWIILGNGEQTSTLRVWALCVPRTDIPVDEEVLDN